MQTQFPIIRTPGVFSLSLCLILLASHFQQHISSADDVLFRFGVASGGQAVNPQLVNQGVKFNAADLGIGLLGEQLQTTPPKETPTPVPAEKQTINIDWPTVPGWEQGKKRLFDPQPIAGYSVPYNSTDGVTVTVYTYHRGLDSIPQNLNAPVVQQELNNSKQGLYQAQQAGLYQKVTEGKEGTVRLGEEKNSPEALFLRFQVKKEDREFESDLYIAVYKDHFIKIRLTRPAGTSQVNEPAVQRLLAAIGKTLQQP